MIRRLNLVISVCQHDTVVCHRRKNVQLTEFGVNGSKIILQKSWKSNGFLTQGRSVSICGFQGKIISMAEEQRECVQTIWQLFRDHLQKTGCSYQVCSFLGGEGMMQAWSLTSLGNNTPVKDTMRPVGFLLLIVESFSSRA